nr:putative invertase inhibitor [Ipomoea batatas]GME05822.1 putative invertase inhibitor [Ipomoea batatas]
MTCIRLVMANVIDTRRHIQAVVNSGKVRSWVRRCVDECYWHSSTHSLNQCFTSPLFTAAVCIPSCHHAGHDEIDARHLYARSIAHSFAGLACRLR